MFRKVLRRGHGSERQEGNDSKMQVPPYKYFRLKVFRSRSRQSAHQISINLREVTTPYHIKRCASQTKRDASSRGLKDLRGGNVMPHTYFFTHMTTNPSTRLATKPTEPFAHHNADTRFTRHILQLASSFTSSQGHMPSRRV